MKISHVLKSGTLILALFFSMIIIQGCGGGGTEFPELTKITDLKGQNWQQFVGQNVTVEGIFVASPVPMLVTNLDAMLANMKPPVDSYLLLTGDQVAELDPATYGGAKLQVQGIVSEVSDEKTFPDDKISVAASSYTLRDKLVAYGPVLAEIDWSQVFVLEHRYAVLYSGGINAGSNHVRYWNDLKFMYSTLIEKYGFTEGNIYVLYANGVGRDADMLVDFSATQANLETVFDNLKEISGENDEIFFFMTNHGGGFFATDSHPHWYGGQRDTNSDEGTESISESTFGFDFDGDGSTNDTVAWDEELLAWGGGIYDDAFVDILNENLHYSQLVIVMEQCFSAGLILDMAQGGGNRVIMAAASEHEPSWAMPPSYTYDEFSYWFTSAINGAEPDGTVVDADTNNDTFVSMTEAFNFARLNDTRPETPQYEDSGDGISHSGAMPSGGDGAFGATVNLD